MAAASINAQAGCENSTLVVHTNSGKPVKVYVDGMTGRNRPTEAVTVNDVPPGRHQLKVVAVYTDYDGYTQRHTILNTTINVRPSMLLDAWVEQGKGVSIHETKQVCDEQFPHQRRQDYDNPPRHYDEQIESNERVPRQQNGNDGPRDNQAQPPMPQQSGNDATPQAAPAQNADLPAAINSSDFEQIRSKIAATEFESKKLETLKSLVGAQMFSTAQVGTLMNLFTFESNKLDVAKLMYAQTVDPANYINLTANFNFDASKQSFKDFMDGK